MARFMWFRSNWNFPTDNGQTHSPGRNGGLHAIANENCDLSCDIDSSAILTALLFRSTWLTIIVSSTRSTCHPAIQTLTLYYTGLNGWNDNPCKDGACKQSPHKALLSNDSDGSQPCKLCDLLEPLGLACDSHDANIGLIVVLCVLTQWCLGSIREFEFRVCTNPSLASPSILSLAPEKKVCLPLISGNYNCHVAMFCWTLKKWSKFSYKFCEKIFEPNVLNSVQWTLSFRANR